MFGYVCFFFSQLITDNIIDIVQHTQCQLHIYSPQVFR